MAGATLESHQKWLLVSLTDTHTDGRTLPLLWEGLHVRQPVLMYQDSTDHSLQ